MKTAIATIGTISIIAIVWQPHVWASRTFTIADVAKQRAVETCYDVHHGANVQWAVKSNLKTGVTKLDQEPNLTVSQSSKRELIENYFQQLSRQCGQLIKENTEKRKKETNGYREL